MKGLATPTTKHDEEHDAVVVGTNQELEPLYRGPIGPKTGGNNNIRRRWTYRSLGILALGILLFVLFVDDEQVDEVIQEENAGTLKIPMGKCGKFCQVRFTQRRQHFGGFDLTQTGDMLKAFQRARESMHADLKRKYGPTHFQKLFLDPIQNNKDAIMQSTPASIQRFQRQLQLKILQVIDTIQAQEDALEGCNCHTGTRAAAKPGAEKTARHRRNLNSRNVTYVLPPVDDSFADFVWSTGGHSAAAGHGNFHNESYTSYLELAARPVLASIGIHLVGRNYAMGGMRSAPELAFCQEAVYGTDADIITYDFGMTDASHDENVPMYGNHIGVHSNHPTTVWIRIQPYFPKNYIQPLDKIGLTEFWIDDSKWTGTVKEIPDMFGMTQEQMDAIPEFIRHYKCNDKVEVGEPTCADQKYNLMTCADRPNKASWHPGWKVNAHYGHFLAMWLVESFYNALVVLDKDSAPKTNTTLNAPIKIAELKAAQDRDIQLFTKSSFPETPIGKLLTKEMIDDVVKPSLLHRVKSICRISLLPSETRARGIMNNHNGVKVHAVPKNEADKTTAAKAAAAARQDSGDEPAAPAESTIPDMRLVNDPKAYDNYKCEIPLKIDYKDFFYANEKDGWTRLVFPNQAEIKAYDTPSTKKVGVLVLCFVLCDWGKCPPGELQSDQFAENRFQLVVNDVLVKELVKMGENCAILKNEMGYIFEPRRNKVNDIELEQYELKAKVNKTSDDQLSYIRITSMILL